jgi:zinc protease
MTTPDTFDLPFLPEPAQRITFENGHTLVFVPKRGRVFNVNTWVKTGSIHEDDVNNGVSHFLEHLMFKGTVRHQPGEFDRAMESMGAIINAATWKDFTFYYVTGPNNGVGEFDKALDMHADMLLHSTLPEAEVGPPYDPADPNYDGEKRERAVVIEEIGMREDQPWTKVYNSVNNQMYPAGHPYRRDVIGTRNIVGLIPRESILGYYRRWYSPAQMTTIVVGDFDFAELCAKVRKAFNFEAIAPVDTAITAGYTEPPAPAQFLGAHNQDGPRFEQVTGDYNTRFFIIGHHGPDIKDVKASIALDIVSYTLGESRSSRMTQNLIEKADVPNFNALGCGQSTFKLGNVFFIQGNFLSDDVETSLAQVKAEVQRFLVDEPMTQAEFDRAVKKMKVQFAEHIETASSLGELVGEALTVAESLTSITEYLPTLETITRDEVMAIARQYLAAETAYTAVLVPQAGASEAVALAA